VAEGSSVSSPDPLDAEHLLDTTVWSKSRSRPELVKWFNEAIAADLVFVCDIVELEVLRSARDHRSFLTQAEQLDLLRRCPIGRAEMARAKEVQGMLSAVGKHRGVPPADLIIAAAAELSHVPVLHYDHDYDLIRSQTAQEARWFLPQGSLP
jgi:predicted nucleic acid-binding protein